MTKRLNLLMAALLVGVTWTTFAGANSETAKHSDSTTYKYIESNQFGDPAEVLEVKTAESPALQKGQVRVKVLAAPIHPSILLQISGNYLSAPKFPFEPGNEGVGRVLEVSEGIGHLNNGQLVLLGGLSTWTEELVAPAGRVVPLPDLGNVTPETIEQLSMASVNPIAALLMLSDFADLKEGDWIVQSAANSAVGSYIIQLAKQRGIKTVNVVRREGLAQELKAMGGDVVLIDGPDLASDIAEATNGAPIALAIDPVGGDTFSRLAASLDTGGTIVVYGVLSGKFPTLDLAMTIARDIRVRGFWLSKWFTTASSEQIQAAFEQIIPLVLSGGIKANVDSRYTVAEIREAVTRANQRGRNGKVLIVSESY